LAFRSASSSFLFRSAASFCAWRAIASLTCWTSYAASTWACSFTSRAAAASACTVAASHNRPVRACARSARDYTKSKPNSHKTSRDTATQSKKLKGLSQGPLLTAHARSCATPP
jgi:hypothetical protein